MMKISGLLARLINLKAEHGDLEVMVWSTGCDDWTEVEEVKLDEHLNCVKLLP